MPNPSPRSVLRMTGPLVPALLFWLAVPSAFAQAPAPVTALSKQLSRIDFALSAEYETTGTVSGVEKRDNTALSVKPSSTVGELVTIRYTAKPYAGFEFNFGNLRYNNDFKFALPTQNYIPGGAQTGVRELSLGYVAHIPHTIYGITPFVGAGAGTIRFKPTTYGGQGLPEQYRAVYYYTAGLEDNFPGSHFGMRLAFRQLIYLAPDFGQNYLTITRRSRSTEPTVGFFVRF